ncbi:MAG: BLUF domain-containing protein [Proteobacteria bacterium]|nr:BLUF domain-containing protein [Pseudomonadota bacterium]
MPDPIYHVVYVSTAVRPLADADLEDLLKQSRLRNFIHGITGILIYDDGKFIQALEGPKVKIDALVRTIRGDRRHRDVTTLFVTENDNLDFPGWAMAYSDSRNTATFADLKARLDDVMQIRNGDPGNSIYRLLQNFLAGAC